MALSPSLAPGIDPEPAPIPTDVFNVSGPALFYASTQENDGGQTVRRLDLGSPENPRERALCRALLHYALGLLDASEPTRPVGVEGRSS